MKETWPSWSNSNQIGSPRSSGVFTNVSIIFWWELSAEDLQRGARLANPLDYFNTEVQWFSEYCHPKCSPSILQKPPQDKNGQEATKPRKWPGPQEQQGDDGAESTKKLQNQPERQKWFNPKYDSTFNATKQAIIQQHGCINLGLLMWAHSTMTLSTLSALGLQTTNCRQYKFWAVCSDPTCKLKHDDTSLTAVQVATVNSIMVEGTKTLQMPKAQQNWWAEDGSSPPAPTQWLHQKTAEKTKRKTVSFADPYKIEQHHHQNSIKVQSYIIDHKRTPSSTIPKPESKKIPQYPATTTDNMQPTNPQMKLCTCAVPTDFLYIQSKYQKVSHSHMWPNPTIHSHPTYPALLYYATDRCPGQCGDPWTKNTWKKQSHEDYTSWQPCQKQPFFYTRKPAKKRS